jgi:hypothetical protein
MDFIQKQTQQRIHNTGSAKGMATTTFILGIEQQTIQY